jgi:hypothetical protein
LYARRSLCCLDAEALIWINGRLAGKGALKALHPYRCMRRLGIPVAALLMVLLLCDTPIAADTSRG